MQETDLAAGMGSAVSEEEAAGWHVAHTRPRCEKKFAAMLGAAGLAHELPLMKSQRRYGARVRVFEKPLFPGYVFVRVSDGQMRRCYEQDLLVRLIRVTDEKTFARQMEGIRRILASGLEAQARPLFAKGRVVRVVAGPLRGMSGVVEDPDRMDGVLVFLDVLQQAVKVKIPAMDLRLE